MSLKDTLALFRERPRSIGELSQAMGLEKREAQDRLDQLVRMGYLDRQEPAPPARKEGCRGCGCCADMSCASSGPSYRLTDRGMRATG